MSVMDDQELTGVFIAKEQMYLYPSISKFCDAIGTSRPTLHKIHTGNFVVRPQVLIAIERALGWPHGSIAAIRAHDLDWLHAHEFPAEPLARLTQELQGRDTA